MDDEKEIITLDHEFGETANITFDPDNEKPENSDEKPLLILPAKYKHLAVLRSIEDVLQDENLSGNISILKTSASARIDFHKLLKDPKKYTEKELNQIETQLVSRINSLIQPNIRKLLKGDELNPADYYRTDMYFTNQRQDYILLIFWEKVTEDE